MKEFFIYFFGKGTEVEFSNFTFAHFAPILLMVALIVLAVIAYASNRMIGPGANYLYMARPEGTPSILDILPPQLRPAAGGYGRGGDAAVRSGVSALVSEGQKVEKSGGVNQCHSVKPGCHSEPVRTLAWESRKTALYLRLPHQ